jgi:hypothetical protein
MLYYRFSLNAAVVCALTTLALANHKLHYYEFTVCLTHMSSLWPPFRTWSVITDQYIVYAVQLYYWTSPGCY